MKRKYKIITKLSIFIIAILCSISGNLYAGWLQGKPYPEQKSFWVFETSWKTRITGSNVRFGKSDFLLTTELGYMKNISPKRSIGATLYLGGDDDGTDFGIKFRYRRWLNRQVSFDISPGILLVSSDNYQKKFKSPGFVASASLGIRDLIALELQFKAVRFENSGFTFDENYELISFNNSGSQTSWYIGARFGSYLAVASIVSLVAIVAITSGGDNFSGFST